MKMTLTVNGKPSPVDVDPFTPLLWVLRDELHFTGTKFGCGRALCGACTVHLDGEAARSCSIMIGEAKDKKITTIEGLSGEVADAVKAAWIEAAVPQCGYCQPGFIMTVTSILLEKRDQPKEKVFEQITNICRCGTYDAMRIAIGTAIETLKSTAAERKPEAAR